MERIRIGQIKAQWRRGKGRAGAKARREIRIRKKERKRDLAQQRRHSCPIALLSLFFF